jgi:hypothetical protein
MLASVRKSELRRRIIRRVLRLNDPVALESVVRVVEMMSCVLPSNVGQRWADYADVPTPDGATIHPIRERDSVFWADDH